MNSDKTGPWHPIARGNLTEGRAGVNWRPSANMTGRIGAPGMWAGMPNLGGAGIEAIGRAARTAANIYAGAALEQRVEKLVHPDASSTAAPTTPSSTAGSRPKSKSPAIVARPAAGSKRGHVLTDVHVKGSRMGMGSRAGLPRTTPIDAESWEATDPGPAPAWTAAAARKVSPLEFPSVSRAIGALPPAGGSGRPSAGRNQGAPSPSAPGPENIDMRTPEGRRRWAEMNVTGKTHIRLGGGFD